MKPKYRSLTRILPTVISIALSIPSATQALIIPDDAQGNVQATSANNGPNTIRANGGTSLNPLVNIIAGVSITGDAVETEVLEITAANYTVTNAGSLSGTNHHGITSTNAFILSNSGTLAGGTLAGRRGVQTVGGLTNITNLSGGLITGTDDAINFTTDGGTVTNLGLINGTTGALSDGISGLTGLTVNNNTNFISSIPSSGGSITGLQYGVSAINNLTLTNQNLATITGTVSGINAGDGAIITNSAGGIITGTTIRGINAGNLATIVNGGSINGGVAGVSVLNNGTITNQVGGLINGGTNDGVSAADLANITNFGTITGGFTGVYLTDITSATVTNNLGALISGGGQGILGGTGVETITNAGTITGSTDSLQLVGGANIVNLNDGSVLNGDARATGGSLAITMNGGLTSPSDSTQNIINGGVFNALTLNKTGSGMAVVTGTTAADTISVSGGYLYLRNNVTNAAGGENTISANASEIGGLGIWDSAITLTNDASISPGASPLALTNTVANSIGAMTITGDVTLDSTSSYIWNVTPGGASDRINLTGVGNIFTTNNSDFVISPTNVNTPLLNGTTIVVDTQDTLVGDFDSISVASFPGTTPDNGPFYANQNDSILAGYFASLTKVNGSQDWQLTIAHDYSQFGTTPNEVAAGLLLNDLFDTATGDLADLLASMDYSDVSVTEGILAALDPGTYMASTMAVANNNFHLHRRVENHNAAVRAGSGTTMVTESSEPSAKGAMPTTHTVASGCSGATNLWGSFSYDWQELETSDSSFDQDGDVYAFTAGIDFTVAENFRLGLVAEGSQSDWDGDFGLGSEVESYRFAAYANWGAATGWFVDALVGYNTHSLDQSHGTFLGNESANYDADGWQGLINVGYAMATSAGTFSPYIGAEWQQLSVDSFETGAGLLPLTIGDYEIDSLRALAGLRWEAEIAERITGYASATYAFQFEEDASDTTVGFGGGSYRATGLEQGDSVLISAGIRWGVGTCTTVDVGYRGEFAMDDGVDSNGANIGVNFSF